MSKKYLSFSNPANSNFSVIMKIMRYEIISDMKYMSYLTMRHGICHILRMRQGKCQKSKLSVKTNYLHAKAIYDQLVL